MKTTFSYIVLLATAVVAGIGNTHAQPANWLGSIDTDWNNGLNWDIGTPAEGTNAIIGGGVTVDYNAPMAATRFAGVNNTGVLNINALGFNIDAGGLAAYTGNAASLWRINSGGVVVATNSGTIALATGSELAVEGGVLIITNSTGNITVGVSGDNNGAGFTNNGGTVTFSQPFESRGRRTRIVLNGGTFNLQAGGGIFESSNDQERQFLVNGGVANLGNFAIGRTLNTVGSAGLVISNGVVNTTSLIVGNGIAAGGATIFGGALTNSGTFTIADRPNAATANQRRVFFYVRGGTVVSTGSAGIIVANQANNSSTGGSSVWGGFLDINAGVIVAEKLTLVGPNALTNAHATLTLAGSGEIYLGAGGLVGNVGYSNTSFTISLNGGTLAAKDDYSIVGNGTLSGTFTVKAADLGNNSRNITNTGRWSGSGALVKTGGGVLTLTTTNTYTGNTTINEGTLALGASGAISNSPTVAVATGAILDVTATTGFSRTSLQNLGGNGTVVGNVIAYNNSTLIPGASVGRLNFSGNLTQAGGVINSFELTAATNDTINVTGILNVTGGTNSISVVALGGPLPGGIYKLFNYGSLIGGITNFTLSGAPGSLSNDVVNKTISLVTTGIRAPTNTIWAGEAFNPLKQNWDILTSFDWKRQSDGAPEVFVQGDTVVFDGTASASNVNIVTLVQPASVTVGHPSFLLGFSGSGNIGGIGTSLTKTNSGTLVILTTNGYTGGTTINGGVVEVTSLANGGVSSGIGASPNAAANLIFDGGTLRYSGASVSTDRAATYNSGGGGIGVSSAATALTISGSATGTGALTKSGAGQLTLSVGSSYSGGTIISNGVLQLNASAAAGTSGITNYGATLRVNGATTEDNQLDFNNTCNLELTGVGSGNIPLRGAWTGNGTVNVNFLTQNASQTLSIGGEGAGGGHMWDFSGTINFGTNQGFTRLNNNSTFNLGSSNATFNLGTSNLIFWQRNGGTTTHLGALLGGLNTRLSGARNDVTGTTTYSIGGKNLDTVFEGMITNGQSGSSIRPASIIKVGTGKLTLTGLSPYTGTTTVEAGILQVDGQITASPITVLGGALAGIGLIGGAVDIQANGILSPGASIGQLTMTNSLTLQSGSTNIMEINKTAATRDSVVGLQSISYGGTLVISNLAGTLAEGDTFKLFDAVPGNYFGAFDFIELPVLGADLFWDTSSLIVDGTVRVFSPRPVIQSFGIDGTNFYLTGTNGGNASAQYILLTSTNAAAPVASWIPIQTNSFDGSGNFAATNAVNPGNSQRYYLLKIP